MGIESVGSRAALARAVAFAAEAGTAQLMIVRDGEVVVDEVFVDDAVDVYAVQKGLVSVLFGIAQERGLLRLTDPVSDHLGIGWTQLSGDAESELRIESVLDMVTGVDAELRPLGEIGVTWRYDNVSYNYLKTVLEVVTGQPFDEICQAWLFDPLAMTSTRWVERPVHRPDGKAITGLMSTARDLTRFGSMVLRGGDGLAPQDYLRSLGRPGSDENPAWGRCWWNNDQTHHRLPRTESEVRQGHVIPGAPADTIAARGALENRLYVVRSLDMVVARTAAPPEAGRRPVAFDKPFWERLAGS